MMNKKGVTLVELIVSMGLISIIILFLFRLFVDVRHMDNTRNYTRDNAQKRAIILNRVQTDFLEKGLAGISDSGNSNSLTLTFRFLDNSTATLTFAKDSGGNYVNYKNSSNEEKWYLESDNDTTTVNLNCVKYSFLEAPNNEYFVVRFSVPIVAVQGSPNIIDDLEFSYVGRTSGVNLSQFPRKTNLGSYQENTCS